MLYFAYGSNMYWPQIKSRCPSADFFRVARLKDHRLAFTRRSVTRRCGSADVVPEPGQDVWGVVFEIAETDIVNLDKAEDFVPGRFENGYTRRQGAVHVAGEPDPLAVSLYLAVRQKNPPLPSLDYKTLILEGAKHWGLPRDYIEGLEEIRVAP